MYRNKIKLWNQNQVTMNWMTPRVSIPHTQRFKLQSIYWPQSKYTKHDQNKGQNDIHAQAKKISKQIDQQQKYRKNVGKDRDNYYQTSNNFSLNKVKSSGDKVSKKFNLKPMSQFQKLVVDRLFVKQPKGISDRIRDKYGFLTCQIKSNKSLQDSGIDINKKANKTSDFSQSKNQIMKDSKGFSKGKRIDLSKPENFYPGPGTYSIARYLQENKVKQSKQKQSQLKQNELKQIQLK